LVHYEKRCVRPLSPQRQEGQSDIKSAGVQVVVVTNAPLKEALKLNEFCHAEGIAFIRADIRGVFASIFTDFGDAFAVLDVDGARMFPRSGQHCSKRFQ
jgi:hypothetical protein